MEINRKSTSWQVASVKVCRIWWKQVIYKEITFFCLQVELWSRWRWRWRCLRAWVCSFLIEWHWYYQLLEVKNFSDNSALQHKTPLPRSHHLSEIIPLGRRPCMTWWALHFRNYSLCKTLRCICISLLFLLLLHKHPKLLLVWLAIICLTVISDGGFIYTEHCGSPKDLTASIPRALNLGALLWGSN